MSVTDLKKDLEAGSLAVAAEYGATPEQVWELWANPRLLERWWGPPSHPATVTDHDLSPGGRVRYYMTGPDGEQYHGGWRVLAATPPRRLELEDFFADSDGNEDAGLPTSTSVVTISEKPGGKTEMVIVTRYSSPEDLSKVLEMGMEEGVLASLGQTDALLAEAAV